MERPQLLEWATQRLASLMGLAPDETHTASELAR